MVSGFRVLSGSLTRFDQHGTGMGAREEQMIGGTASRSSMRRWSGWGLALVAIVATRLLTPINYIADPDSLRFALGLIEFDVAALQPHFPGYPVFIGLAKLIALSGLPIGITFALVGSIASLLLLYGFLLLVRTDIDRPEGLLALYLVLFTPMIWLMATRYMPDLLGAAVALLATALLVRNDYQSPRLLALGALLTGILCGIRLSYLPLLLLPMLVASMRAERKGPVLAALLLGVLLWFVPMVLDTGLPELWEAGLSQSVGHFSEFGGTVETAPGLDARRLAIIEGVVADGLGGYWQGRHPVTVLTLIGLVILFARGVWYLFEREPEGLLIVVFSLTVYTGWILLYQNVLYQPRHVLPLLPFLLAPVWAGGVVLLQRGIAGRLLVVATLAALAISGTVPALQQTEPTAIARAAEVLRSAPAAETTPRLRSTPLLCWLLTTTGVAVECEPVDAVSEGSDRPEYVVGWFLSEEERPEYRRLTFRHNPYVNAIWPEVPLWIRRDLPQIDRRRESGGEK